MKKVFTENAPAAIGPYSQATIYNGFIFTSGQLGINPLTGNLAEGIEEQTIQVIKNIIEILKSQGIGLENVIKTTCFLENINNFDTFNKIYSKYFTSFPSRSCIEVSALPKDALVEIEIIAAV